MNKRCFVAFWVLISLAVFVCSFGNEFVNYCDELLIVSLLCFWNYCTLNSTVGRRCSVLNWGIASPYILFHSETSVLSSFTSCSICVQWFIIKWRWLESWLLRQITERCSNEEYVLCLSFMLFNYNVNNRWCLRSLMLQVVLVCWGLWGRS
jgi:hypothetical protein